jgi:hypothetical protein
MLIYAFRNGRKAGTWTETTPIRSLIEFCDRYKGRWREQNDWCFDDLPDGAKRVVETQLIVRRTPQERFRVTHSLAAQEKQEPDTVFIGAIENDEYDALGEADSRAWFTSQKQLRSKIKEMNPAARKTVYWADLSDTEKVRLVGSNLSTKECWIWRAPKRDADKFRDAKPRSAPYRAFYMRIKGPVPIGIVLRHKCDNRMCMNPNHLLLGTPKDNVRDMMRRRRIIGRHLV